MQDYRKIQAISQSSLKDWEKKLPLVWKNIWFEGKKDEEKDENVYFFGTLVDNLCFNNKNIKHLYHVSDVNLPSGTTFNILNLFIQKIKNHNITLEESKSILPIEEEYRNYKLADNEDFIEEILSDIDWYSNWSMEKKINNIISNQDAVDFLLASNDKIVINKKEMELGEELRNNLYSNPYTYSYFVATKGIELIFQQEIVIEIDSILRKCAIDIIKIDHNNRTVEIIDLKTCRNVSIFEEDAKLYNYPGQLTFYKEMLHFWRLSPEFKEKWKEYEIKGLYNIAIDRIYKIPLIYSYSQKTLQLSTEKWEKNLKEIAWHFENNFWDAPMEIKLKGKIELNFNL